MQAEQVLRFGPYRFDLHNEQLWRGTQAVKVTGKALAVLRYLIEHPGQVVSKEDLFRTVWSGTVVSDAALTACIQELRWALHDDARNPRFIETVHRRGYRFIGAVRSHKLEPTPNLQSPTPSFVGRERELQQLHKWLDTALHSERQIVFVTGEPGIGKTALVEAFLVKVAAEGAAWIGRGQCIEHYGVGEAYLPLLEALGRLCREPDGQRVRASLKQVAPTWLVQMPALLRAKELEALQRKVAGATKERMLRELAEAVEALTTERPLVLWLEDLHWSDVSTLDWLAFVARRQESARLLVIGTYRPVDVLAREHPVKAIKQELQLHGHCAELPPDFLTEEHVAEYLMRRFAVGAHGLPLQHLARLIHQRSDGNPLFMINLVDHLLSQGLLVQVGGQLTLKEEKAAAAMPENLRQMIEQRLAQVGGASRAILEVASIAGAEFSAAAVAAGAEVSVEVVEEQCAELARQEQFLRASGAAEWPDGTVAARYGFLHAVYQEVLYERMPAGRQQRLHQQIGEREEQAYGIRAREIAAELAMHFEQGRDYRKAVQYLEHAGKNAIRRNAHREAISLLTKGLKLLKTWPDTSERTQQELALQITLGNPLQATKGYSASEVEKVYARVLELCQQVGETPQLFPALWGIWVFYLGRAELQAARGVAEQLLSLAQRQQDPALLLEAHRTLGATRFWLGELVPAREHLEQSIALYDTQQHRSHAFLYGHDPGVHCLSYMPLALWLLGYPNQALQRSHEALTLAQDLSQPMSLAFALGWAALFHPLRCEEGLTQERAEAAIGLSGKHGFPVWFKTATIMQGWALAVQGQGEEGIVQMRQGLAALRATNSGVIQPYFLARLAESYARVGQIEEGLSVLAEALAKVSQTGERVYEAELCRLKGQLTLQKFQVPGSKFQGENPQSAFCNPQSEAEACFHKAIEIARQQQAKSLELRAVMSLSRLWQQQGKKEEAHKMLAEIYGWFTEGFDTKDLQEAKALLEEFSH